MGDEVYASANGKIILVQKDKVVIDHGCSVYTGYHHIDPIVSNGDSVESGALVGYVGFYEDMPDPHLHFQLELETESSPYQGDYFSPVDPMQINLWSENAIRAFNEMPELKGYKLSY